MGEGLNGTAKSSRQRRVPRTSRSGREADVAADGRNRRRRAGGARRGPERTEDAGRGGPASAARGNRLGCTEVVKHREGVAGRSGAEGGRVGGVEEGEKGQGHRWRKRDGERVWVKQE